MDTTTLTPAQRHYASCLKAQKRYYQKVREARLAKYKLDHPNPNPVGRPKKVVEPPEEE